MVDVTSPLPDGTDIGTLIGGKFHSWNLLTNPDGTPINPATAQGQTAIASAITALGNALAINDPATGGAQAAMLTALGSIATLLANADYFPDTQAVSLASAPLPNGAATATQQTAIVNALAAINTLLTTPPTQPIAAAALPLPAGAATASAQSSMISALLSVVSLLTTPPVQTITATALPLPNGAATASAQSAQTAAVQATASADDLFAITPSDTADLATVPKALYVVTGGTLSVKGAGGSTVSLGTVVAGQVIPLRARRVNANGTTATVVGMV